MAQIERGLAPSRLLHQLRDDEPLEESTEVVWADERLKLAGGDAREAHRERRVKHDCLMTANLTPREVGGPRRHRRGEKDGLDDVEIGGD